MTDGFSSTLSAHEPYSPQRKVLSIYHSPRMPFEGGRRLHQVLRWNEPQILEQKFIADVSACSHGQVEYEIVDRIVVDVFPPKADGFVYTPQGYVENWLKRKGFHRPDTLDYYRLIDEFDILSRVQTHRIDEVWLFGFPYAGYYESIMAGPGAFWCNAPPLDQAAAAGRRFVIMGFNVERGIGEMLENLGHRAESILARVFAGSAREENLWERFTRVERTHPGNAEVGTVHFAPNSERDYDWGNPRRVESYCDDWVNFPDFKGVRRKVSSEEWGGGAIRAHHLWWFRHFPHQAGTLHGRSTNWWEYVIDPQRVPV
jgi:hypothetical protein